MNILTTEFFIQRAKEVHGNLFDYSKSVYTGRFNKISIICKKHGEFFQTPGNHYCGKGCPTCKREKLSKNRSFTVEEFVTKSKLIHKKYNYELVNYINTHTPVKIICPLHGIFSQAPMHHLKGQGCPKCGLKVLSKKFSSNIQEFIRKAKIIHGEKYNYIFASYKNAQTKVKIFCSKHGSFKQTPNKHLSGQGCPDCAESLGETSIRSFLSQNGIPFVTKKIFDDCRFKRPLPFDFFLPTMNTLIEYDGKQHFAIVDFTSSKSKDKLYKNLESIQKNDSIKNFYCKNNGIKLIRIPYTEFKNVGVILKHNLLTINERSFINGSVYTH